MAINTQSVLPQLIAGPIVRHVCANEVTFWLVTDAPYEMSLSLTCGDKTLLDIEQLDASQQQTIAIGRHAYVQLIHVKTESLPPQTPITYQLALVDGNNKTPLSALAPHLCYQGEDAPSFIIPNTIQRLMHGSCRKPHFDSDDGLARLDQEIAQSIAGRNQRPDLLMMSGDQVYADDVAGPMLVAIHQVIHVLGLHDEQWQGAVVNESQLLYQHPFSYYQRDQLLPHNKANKAVYEKLFAASKKPIFTSVNAKNHLVTFAETMAMYLLAWSPSLWQLVDLEQHNIDEKHLALYNKERKVIERFVEQLPQVHRAMANIAIYMIFDDHDITDDWNLTRGWEEAAYQHPFSKRIIGNALVAYWLCQGWGNAPQTFTALNSQVDQYINPQGLFHLDRLIDNLLDWQDWHYTLATTPKIVVLDTRTQRWRSESNAAKPSGLMDWEALTALQQELIDEPRVIMVSAAPVYGVKLIETIQRIFTFFGKPLMVDAENWMAHAGTANVMLNIFRHQKTPPEFIILSGDVHYSFVYDVTHRFIRNSSKIVQITSSGIKNEFPRGLLKVLDKLNRVLYAPYSPLNWFTKRRRMKVKVRYPNGDDNGTLFCGSAIGEIIMTDDEHLVEARSLTVDGQQVDYLAKTSGNER